MDLPAQFRIICSALTIASTFYLLLAIYSFCSSSFVTYKFYLIAFITSNVLQAFEYNLTTIIGNTWNNCYIMSAKGSIKGPGAIGLYLVMSSQTFTLLSFMFLFRFAKVRSPTLLGHLSNRLIIRKMALATSISSLFFYSLPAFFFRPNATAIYLVADFVRLMHNQGRDFAFEMSIACYWEKSLYTSPNLYAVSGLFGFYLVFIAYFIFLTTLTVLIIKFLRSRGSSSRSVRQLKHEKGHLEALWFQFFLALFLIIINRVGWASLPLFSTLSHTSLPNRFFRAWCTFSLPLHPLLSNITLILGIRELRRWLDRVIRRTTGRVQNVSMSGVSLSNSPLDK